MQLPRFPWRPRLFIDETFLKREGSSSQGRKLTYKALELGSNNFSVTLVACLGFFTSSYLLFSSNITLPMLGFVYWHDATTTTHETAINYTTISGCMVGMVFFGLLADIYGRRKIYGYVTVLLMVATMGVVMSSTGYTPLGQTGSENLGSIDFSSYGSMDIQSWLLFWRFVSGIAIGGDYPLSAVIVSEYAPTSKRPRMLATVFAMQSFGIAAASVVSVVATTVVQKRHPYDPANPEASARAVDQIWRWVIGLGLIPTLLTAIMRFTIPESPRYTLDVLKDPFKAYEETERLKRFSPSNTAAVSQHSAPNDEENITSLSTTNGHGVSEDPQSPTIKQYFWIEGNWRYLLATSLSWFVVDFSTFSLGINNTQTLSKFWNGPTVVINNPKVWDSNTSDPNASIFSILIGNSVHLLVIISIPEITSSILIILFITRLNRKLLTWVMFLVTGTLFIITGATLLKTTGSQSWGINIAMYALCNFSQQFGMGPLTFLLPAELFPTGYRASCHGISAASGKFGSIVAFVFLRYVTFGEGENKITSSGSPLTWLGYVFMIFAVPLFLGAGVCWQWIPELQDSSGNSKTLEQLAEGRKSARPDIVADS